MNYLIISVLFIIGVIFISIDVVKSYYKCPPDKTIYKFVPRTFEEEQDYPIPVETIFDKMFALPSPWVHSFDIHKTKKDSLDNIYKS